MSFPSLGESNRPSRDLGQDGDEHSKTRGESPGGFPGLVRLVQQARRSAGFHVADHIELSLGLGEDLQKIVEQHKGYIASETLADQLQFGKSGSGSYSEDSELNGESISIELRVI